MLAHYMGINGSNRLFVISLTVSELNTTIA